MLVESRRIREMLNAPITQGTPAQNANPYSGECDGEDSWQVPKSYMFSMNPIPALILLLLGLMMSSHHQTSMVSTMVHKQWGTLFVGAAFARALTYIIFYLSPPVSVLPSRPPSELITAFCLTAGGLIFMASVSNSRSYVTDFISNLVQSHDTIEAMEVNNLDAMFVFTVSMGVVTFLMAWIILVIAVKGWAVRRENRLNFF